MINTQNAVTIDEYAVRVERDFFALTISPEQWDALLEASISPYIFLRYWWLHCWMQTFRPDGKALIISVYRDEEMIGIAPLTIERSWCVGLSYRCAAISRRGGSRLSRPDLPGGRLAGRCVLRGANHCALAR